VKQPIGNQSEVESLGFNLDEHLPYLLVRSANQVGVITQKQYQNTTPDGLKLSLREFRTLVIVAVRNVVSPAAVADATGMDRSTVTRALATLRGKSLIKETPNENDKRAKLLQLTEQGRALSDQILPRMKAYDHLMEAEFSQKEISQFSSMLDRLVHLFAQGPK
jgi:DNA-binding MarR family transcriptional regulator